MDNSAHRLIANSNSTKPADLVLSTTRFHSPLKTRHCLPALPPPLPQSPPLYPLNLLSTPADSTSR